MLNDQISEFLNFREGRRCARTWRILMYFVLEAPLDESRRTRTRSRLRP